jgi:hypothetical protein
MQAAADPLESVNRCVSQHEFEGVAFCESDTGVVYASFESRHDSPPRVDSTRFYPIQPSLASTLSHAESSGSLHSLRAIAFKASTYSFWRWGRKRRRDEPYLGERAVLSAGLTDLAG